MIHKYCFKNFYSFKGATTVDFTVDKKASDIEGFSKDFGDTRVNKVVAILGPNASGKTNALKALPFIKWLVVDSFTSAKEEHMPMLSFFTDRQNGISPSEVSVTFSVNQNLYEYCVAIKKERILSETLKKLNKRTNRYKSLYDRQAQGNEGSTYEVAKSFKLSAEFLSLVPNKATILSTVSAATITNEAMEELKQIGNYWKTVYTSIDYKRFYNNKTEGPIEENMEITDSLQKDPQLKEAVEKLLRNFDLGSVILRFEKIPSKVSRDTTKREIYFPLLKHKFLKGELELPLIIESSGTQRLIKLLSIILRTIREGSIAVIDEFDNVIHPSMLNELLDLFLSSKFNSTKAQLIFTTHQVQVMNKLEKQQIALVEKDADEGRSTLYRLDTLKGIRTDENYLNKYLSGAYGGIPNI